MDSYCFKWDVKHQWGDKSIFSEYFTSYNYTWRLALISADRPYVHLEYFGYLTFEVFTDYIIYIEYTDGEKEEKEITFGFGSQLDFGIEVQPKEKKMIAVAIKSAVRCYESKKDTPYTGLINLGATCYLNTIIQTLFHIKEFTKELFKQPPGEKTVQMQKLFYNLGKDAMYADTKDFTNAFKLKDEDIDEQQDIQEFFKVLLDELEKEAKNTPFFKYIEDTFYGTLGTTIRCEKGCVRERTEKYNDLQLVMDLPCMENSRTSLEDSLHDYVRTTDLHEPNLYNCEEHGYVKATKTDYCKTFPPVLFLQVKRFNMNYETGDVYKLNNYYSFPKTIDLSQYTPDKETDNNYTLYAVNVHMGNGMSEGHYYAYIKKSNGWYKFNDNYVTRCMEKEAVQETFGGRHPYKNRIRTSNAYYLVYIRTSQINKILNAEVNEVPADVKMSVEKEKFLAEKIKLDIYIPCVVKGYWGKGYFTEGHQYLKSSPAEVELENSHSYNQIISQVKKLLISTTPSIDSILLYEIENGHSLKKAEKIEIIADLHSHSLFAIEADKNIKKEDTFILFVKQTKTVGQPYSLKVLIEVHSVHVVNKTATIKEWIKAGYKTSIAPFAEIDGSIKEIDDRVTFEKLFKADSGIIILGAGNKTVTEYFKTLSLHKIITLVHKEQQVCNYWISSNTTEKEMKPVLKSMLGSDKFEIKCIEERKVHIELPDAHVIAYLLLLGKKTENVNLVEKKAYILPEIVTGEEILSILGVEKTELTPETRILKSSLGVESILFFKPNAAKISLEDMALVAVQEVSKKLRMEAAMKYSTELIGYPFLMDIDGKKSSMELKRVYGIENSILLKTTPLKQVQLEEMAPVKKLSKNEKLIFKITYYQKYQLKFTRLYFG